MRFTSLCCLYQICLVNTRLAAVESMTHDVIRDLLGVKLDMTSYAVSLDSIFHALSTNFLLLLSDLFFFLGHLLVLFKELISQNRLQKFVEEAQRQTQECNALVF